MSTKPILFSTDMVRAILEDRKTVTRRVVKPQPMDGFIPAWRGNWDSVVGSKLLWTVMPPYQPGDILYVRETWCPYDRDHIIDGIKYAYKANTTPESDKVRQEYGYKWNPSIHMPKEAARIFLRVTDVRVERLQDITPEQIDAEGFKEYGYSVETGELMPSEPSFFMIGWDKTIKPSDLTTYGWAANPWVWVIEFERISREEMRVCATKERPR